MTQVMTPEQHQIERMRAWVAFLGMWQPGVNHRETGVELADSLLTEFDARFPAPQPEAPPEAGTHWTPHIPGDAMPFHDGRREVYVQYRSGTLRRMKGFDVRWDTDPDRIREVIRWKFAT